MVEQFKLTDDEISQINKLVNDMEFEPKYVCDVGVVVREVTIRGQLMEVYIQVRSID